MGIWALGRIGKGGIQDKRRPGTRAKGGPGILGPADFRPWSGRSRTRVKVLPGVPRPAEFRAWSYRDHWVGPVG